MPRHSNLIDFTIYVQTSVVENTLKTRCPSRITTGADITLVRANVIDRNGCVIGWSTDLYSTSIKSDISSAIISVDRLAI
jgi:hypothetical protein